MRNVVWKTGGVKVKGGNHIISRNTIFDTGKGYYPGKGGEGGGGEEFKLEGLAPYSCTRLTLAMREPRSD